MITHTFSYEIGEKVFIDGDHSIVGTITASCVETYHHAISYKIEYFHEGCLQVVWAAEQRLTSVASTVRRIVS